MAYIIYLYLYRVHNYKTWLLDTENVVSSEAIMFAVLKSFLLNNLLFKVKKAVHMNAQKNLGQSN